MRSSEEASLYAVGRDQVLKISPQDSIAQAAQRMRDHRAGSLIVVDESDTVVGIITERDIIASSTASSAHPDQMRVADVMTTKLISVTPDTSVSSASQLMAARGIRHLPLIQDGQVVGIISTRDIMARQLRLTEGMKAAAEQVALLSKGLHRLDLEEVIEILSTEVPRMFQAQRWVFSFANGETVGGMSPHLRGRGCPCLDQGRAAGGDAPEAVTGSEAVSGEVPPACRRLGADGFQVFLPLDEPDATNHRADLGRRRRSYLCMCGLPQAQGDSAEVLQYKLALIRDVLAINLMNAKLSRVAYHDALTGLRTRRVMEEAIAEEHARSTRNGHPFCVTMVDVDNFKSVNDRHGHPAGDKMLLELAGILRANARAYDLIARCGGDEFVLLMPETPLDVAAAVAERIRHRVESDLTVPDGRQVTISCGVAEWAGEAEDTGTAVLRRADVALYEAKRSGRNRVVPAVAPAPAK